MSRRAGRSRHAEPSYFSPFLDVLLNFVAAILLLLLIYIFLNRDQPCVFVLSERDAVFRFASGTATLSSDFRAEIERRILPSINERHGGCDGDVIEVIGHTDAQPIQGVYSSLDREVLEAYASGNVAGLVPGSNVDLGFLRALSIVTLLKELQAGGRLPGIQRLVPLSAGAAVLPDRRPGYDGTSEPDPDRRRIEIRILRSDAWSDLSHDGSSR